MSIKPKFDYLYLQKSKLINHREHFEVIRVSLHNVDAWTAELKARRYAREHKLGKLAGGSFNNTCKPYDFATNYKVHICPRSQKPARENKHDKFIANLIDAEENAHGVMIGMGQVIAF